MATITLRLADDILAHYKGPLARGYQSRIEQGLRRDMQTSAGATELPAMWTRDAIAEIARGAFPPVLDREDILELVRREARREIERAVTA
jgi:hypothetical protein